MVFGGRRGFPKAGVLIPICATFHADPPLGILQISSARKEASPISGEDLKELAGEWRTSGKEIQDVKCGSFSGFLVRHSDGDRFRREWWLGSGHLMVYVTYNVVQGAEDLEIDKIEAVLGSLTPI
jgi:hypothetical protein